MEAAKLNARPKWLDMDRENSKNQILRKYALLFVALFALATMRKKLDFTLREATS